MKPKAVDEHAITRFSLHGDNELEQMYIKTILNLLVASSKFNALPSPCPSHGREFLL